MPEALDTLLNFVSALAIGLLIGAERGWQERNSEDGQFAAGIRTFGLSALLGGIVSSTAMTVSLARLNQGRQLQALLACGLLTTSALMFPRVLLEVGLINAKLLPHLIWPLSAAAAVYALGALFYYRLASKQNDENAEPPLKNPFELGPALRFGMLLLLILFLVEAAQHWLGDAGVYLVALVSGLADVDAITLSLARSADGELSAQVAVHGIFLAALSNSLVKGLLIALIGGRQLALRTLPVMAAGLLAGLAVLLLL
ncbi:MgtC/SapB family protein [Pseudomonas borbori]